MRRGSGGSAALARATAATPAFVPASVPALVLAFVLAFVLGACSGKNDLQIRTAPVGRASVIEVVEAPGTVSARASAAVASPGTGRIAALRVREGQAVKVNQVLFTVDSPSARQQLAAARDADRQAASASARIPTGPGLSGVQEKADKAAARSFSAAREAAGRIPDPNLRQQAVAAVATAESQYRAASAQAAAALAQVRAGIGSLSSALSSLGQAQRIQTRAAVTAAQRAVDALTVRAPISGVVSLGAQASGGSGAAAANLGSALESVPESLRGAAGSLLGGGSSAGASGTVSVGTPVSTGQQIATVTDVSTLTLTAEVDETDVLLVRPRVPASVELDAVPDSRYTAAVTSVDVAPTTSARGGVAYAVRLSLGGGRTSDGDPAPEPRPGMSAVISLRVRTAANAVALPASAIVRNGNQDAVWVVSNGVVHRRVVRLGAQGPDKVAVTEGVREGEQVVVSGADRAHEGQRLT